MKKQEQDAESKFTYPYPYLQKFAKIIAEDYKNDYYKFLIDRKALTKDNKAIFYQDPTVYYQQNANDFNLLEDDYRPQIPMAFWSRLHKQADRIMMRLVEDMYAQELSLTGVDSRQISINKIKEKLQLLGIVNSQKTY
jgi:hypothetical protein